MIINLSRRAHDHNWELDPITRSLLDTDFYKLLMLQFIWKHFPTTRATFSLINRTTAVPLGQIIGVDELREQLEENHEVPPKGRKWKVAVCGPQRPAQVALGPDFTIGWDSHAADFAMTLGEFYCKGLTAPVMVEIKRDDVVFARVYDIRGRSISSLLSIPAP